MNEESLAAALDWLLRVRETPDDPAVRADLSAWLARSDDNLRAYRQVEKVWHLAGDVPPVHADRWGRHRRDGEPAGGDETRHASAPARPVRVSHPRRDSRTARRAHRRPSVRSGLRVVAAAAAAALLLLALPSAQLRLQADYRTGIGQTRAVTLEDGTTVHLNADSAMSVDYGPTRRQARLLAGEAFFEVASDAKRPFSVEAEGVTVSVIGTAFDLNLGTNAVAVAVQHGVVMVRHDLSGQPQQARLSENEQLTVDRDTGATIRNRLTGRQAASWRAGQLVVHGAPVVEVVEELRRYHRGVILLPDAALAAKRVTGVYDLRDPVKALRTAVHPHAGTVREITPFVLVISSE